MTYQSLIYLLLLGLAFGNMLDPRIGMTASSGERPTAGEKSASRDQPTPGKKGSGGDKVGQPKSPKESGKAAAKPVNNKDDALSLFDTPDESAVGSWSPVTQEGAPPPAKTSPSPTPGANKPSLPPQAATGGNKELAITDNSGDTTGDTATETEAEATTITEGEASPSTTAPETGSMKMTPALATMKGVTASVGSFTLANGNEVFGAGVERYVVQGHETLLELALVNDLGYNEITLANPGIDPWVPDAGDLVKLPFRWILPEVDLKGQGIMINLAEMRLFHRMKNGTMTTYPLGIGQEGLDTPVGKTTIVRKQASPTWYVPKSILIDHPDHVKSVPPGPDNPLGTHALYLGLTSGSYLMHGTNQPFGVGRRVSHGCIRMYPDDIPRMFEQTQVGETVIIVNQPAKAGWEGDQLFLEVHPILEEKPDMREQLSKLVSTAINHALARRPMSNDVKVDWETVEMAVTEMDGVPHLISTLDRPSGDGGSLTPSQTPSLPTMP